MSYKVNEKHTLDEYKKKYGNKNLKEYSKEDVAKDQSILENKQWWLIEGTYYEVDKSKCAIVAWWLGLAKAAKIGVIVGAALVCAGAVAGIIVGCSKKENVPTVKLEYYDTKDDPIKYTFSDKIDYIKVNETEWTFNFTLTDGEAYSWYVCIFDMADEYKQIAKGEEHPEQAAMGKHTEKAKLLPSIDLKAYADKTLTVAVWCSMK